MGALILSALISIGLIGCAGHRPSKAEDSSKPSRHPQEDLSIAHDFFLRARSQELAGNTAAALGYYQLAHEYNPSNRDLCFLLLDHYRNAGMLDSAIAVGKTCFTLKGTATSVENQSMGEAYLRNNNEDSAVHYYEESFRLDEDNREALYVLVSLYEKRRDIPHFTGAVRKLLPMLDYPSRMVDKLLQAYALSGQVDSIGPFLNEAWRETGQITFAEQLAAYYGSLEVRGLLSDSVKKDSALALYAQVLDKNEDDSEILFPYALLLQDRNRLPEAYTALKKLVDAEPDNAMYQYALGSLCLDLHKPEARIHLEKAARIGSGIPDYWARLIYSDLAFGFDSVATYRELHLPDSLPEGWKNTFFQGLVHSLLAQNLEAHIAPQKRTAFEDSSASKKHRGIAIEFFRASLADAPENKPILFELGTNLDRIGKRDSSIQVLRQLVKTDTLNSMAMNYLGYMLVEENTDLDFAGKLIDRALRLEPENGAYLDSKGWWYYREKDFRAAEAYLQKALLRLHGDPTVQDHLMIVQKVLNGKN